MVQVLLKPGLENFKHYFTSVWNSCNCAVVWAFFSIAFLWDWNENWPFPVLGQLLSFPNLLAYWVQHLILWSCSFLRNNSVVGWYLQKGRFIRNSHLLLMCHKCGESEVPQCLTLWDPLGSSQSVSSLQEILQARILEWVATSFSRGSFQPKNWTQVSVLPSKPPEKS